MSRNWIALTLLSAIALTGCSTKPAVPDTVQKMMDAEIPADGKIHVQRLRQIIIKPVTDVCDMWLAAPESARYRYFGINSDDLFRPLGQSSTGDGGDRQISAKAKVCADPTSVVIYGLKTSNRDGAPYKLVLAVWQGDQERGGAAWVGGIERSDGVRPDSRELLPFRDGLPSPSWAREKEDREYRIGVSVERDVHDLSEAFTHDVIKAGH